MLGIKNYLGKFFGPNKIKSNFNPNETVAFDAKFASAKI